MSTLALKIAGGTVAIGSLGTATYFGGRELLRSSTIKEKLIKEEFKFISSSNTKQWQAEFESDQVAIQAALGTGITDGSTLKAWCESKFDSSSNYKKDLKNVKAWCGIRDIASQLKRKKQTLLVGLSGDDVAGKWKETISKRKTNNKGAEKLNLGENWHQIDKEITAKVQSWCTQNSKADYLVEEAEKNYKLVHAWCTEEGKTVQLT